jgi:EAL domain-containing protein (putative c-di-GMP-specific phosphodiesterase class I)
MEAGLGVNSPEFLQKKIERLKSALDEANALMDRHVTERDEARAELDALKRERDDLKRQVDQLQAQAGGEPAAAQAPAPEPAPPATDPRVEQELRDRIAQLESERESLQAGQPADDQALRDRADYLQRELDNARGDLATARTEIDNIRRDADTARAAADSARADADTAKREADNARAAAETARREAQTQVATTTAAGQRRPSPDADLPAAGPFVSQEVIRDALDNDNFVLFCQPVFSLQAERITQYELLLRLRDADGRMVRPFSFLEPADRFGLMAEIDRWVVTHALDLLERDPTGDIRLEVNIAAQSLMDFELTALIEQQIAMTDLDPGRLIIELSENVAAAHLEDAQRLAKRLRGLGCGFALDDFGSTFASFRHLRDLPLNYLKIDGDLVVTVTESRTGQLTIKSLVELARGLGAETIAEYVSDDQTLEFLREQGVGYAQGYRIGRPRPVEEVLDMQGTHEHQPQPPVRVERPALHSGDEDGEPAGDGDGDGDGDGGGEGQRDGEGEGHQADAEAEQQY